MAKTRKLATLNIIVNPISDAEGCGRATLGSRNVRTPDSKELEVRLIAMQPNYEAGLTFEVSVWDKASEEVKNTRIGKSIERACLEYRRTYTSIRQGTYKF